MLHKSPNQRCTRHVTQPARPLIVMAIAVAIGMLIWAQRPMHEANSPINALARHDRDGTGASQPYDAHREVDSQVLSQVAAVDKPVEADASRMSDEKQPRNWRPGRPDETQDQFLTTENVGLFFLSRTDAARDLLARALQSQPDNFAASTQAETNINSIFVQSEIGDLAKDWLVDCRGSICIAAIEDSALKNLNEDPVNMIIQSHGFERVLWYRDYKADTTTIYLLRPEFRYSAGNP